MDSKKSVIRNSQVDYWLVVTVAFLLGIGSIMVFSSSTVSSYNMSATSDSYSILTNHIIYLCVSLVVMVTAAFVNYKVIQRISVFIYLASVLLLVGVLIPGVGVVINNARRWIDIGIITIQPSEIAKFGVIVILAYLFTNDTVRKYMDRWWSFVIYLPPLLLVFVLLYLEPHASCIVIIGLVAAVMIILAGAKLKSLIVPGLAGILGVVMMYFTVPHFTARINSFLGIGGEAESPEATYQITQSLYAIGSGGLTGRGLGNSVQKYQYLPEPYNDFIFSILAEELGFLGVALVMLLFGILIWRGYKIAIFAPDKYSSLLATGITTLIAIQVVLNIAVVTKTIPVTGVSLPFFSYGGTSLIMICGETGILMGISKKTYYPKF